MLTYGRIARTVERSDHPTIRLSDTYHRRARLLLLVRCRAGAVRPDAHHSAAGRDLLDRALRVRQEHVPPVHQPHERALARNAPRRRHPARRNLGVLPRDRSRHAAPARGDGVPAAEPPPQVDLRQCGLRPPLERARPGARDARAGGASPAPGGPVGRGEGPAARARPQPLRRPATAAVHRARAGERARGPAARRALLGARSHRDAAHRGAARRAEGDVCDGDRHAQHAAGGAHLGLHGVLLPRAPHRVRLDAVEAYITGRFG